MQNAVVACNDEISCHAIQDKGCDGHKSDYGNSRYQICKISSPIRPENELMDSVGDCVYIKGSYFYSIRKLTLYSSFNM